MKKLINALVLITVLFSVNTADAFFMDKKNYTADDFIKKLNLEKHIEGGSFKRVYTSTHKLPIAGYEKDRFISTAIYFLLEGKDFSAFHRLKSDEIWAFNYGSPLTLYVIDAKGKLDKFVLGDPEHPTYQITVPANHWFAAEINDKTSFTLVSCFVSPGFEYMDFELAQRDQLIKQFPQHENIITRLTRVEK